MVTEEQRERRKQYSKQYRLQNKDRLKAQRAEYRKSKAHREWLNNTRAYRVNRETTRARMVRQSSVESWLRHLLISARTRKWGCTVILDDLLGKWKLQNGLCAMCGLLMTHKFHTLSSASMDRIDSTKGYTPDNTQLVARWVNIAKSNRPAAELQEIIDQLRANQ